MSTYEVLSLVFSGLALLISGISLFLISNIYSKINGNNNQSAVIKDGNQNRISQKK